MPLSELVEFGRATAAGHGQKQHSTTSPGRRDPDLSGTCRSVDLDELGRRIRNLRLQQRMTLKQVEESSGLSATHLSEIERGRTSPTIGALIRIARSLKRDTSYFVELEERDEASLVTRERAVAIMPADGVTGEALTPGIPGSGMFSYRLCFVAPGAELRLEPQELPGGALYLIRRGTLEAVFGESRLALGAGDSAQASLSVPHRMHSMPGEPAEVIAILTRPLPSRPSSSHTSGGES